MGSSEPNRLIYASPNGDRWHLLFDPTTGYSFVRHTGNIASGGHVTDFSLPNFLTPGRNGPEHQELWRLIGTLVGEDEPRQQPIDVA
ncbi:hypothetical protein MKL09_00180 [Methylobacterium sp. J-048]|uniref:hypothetical protein n=1 Tax=Methylobacterium sp. J-048 TaxID=2836635 RepID=UPI001FB8C561|nr:hypothetical protein [Methylobacterium sp. J-048]MCJ2054979.1 hypothetical protein [Methylobacterium sp. J-048]